MGVRSMVKLRGLNRRQISVDTYSVLFLEEIEIDGNLVTNIHFGNGRWVTAGLSLNEALAELQQEPEKQDEKANLDRWRAQAKVRREMELEVEAAMKAVDLKGKVKSYTSEKAADGTRRIELFLEAETPIDVQGT